MIPQPTSARIFLACGVTDMRKGFDGLAVADSDDRAQPFRHDGAQRSEMIAISGGYPVDMDLVSAS
ncbi:hypothetical protein ASE82_18145 [Sphingomonas sp. Leaf230]|nr:hypothetical protein ASE82_18145 [Sphingomonas sp. Leaf230]